MADFSVSYFNDRYYNKLTKSGRVLTNASVFNISIHELDLYPRGLNKQWTFCRMLDF